MLGKTVVIVEDQEPQRLALHSALERRGFQVKSAATVAEARYAIEFAGEEIDVMVLDMRLEDPNEPDTTGADIGIQVQEEHPDWLPEYLIQSSFAEVNYYRLALRLGVAAYLSKAETNQSDLIQHVRALALKRALRLERPRVAEILRSISEATKSLSAAVRKFCREILAGELDTCLGAPYMLLLTDENGTQNFATNTDMPVGYEPLYTTLQAMAHGISNFSSPYTVSEQGMKYLPQPNNHNELQLYERLPRAVFIPLANVKNFRLSIGLFESKLGETKYPEDIGKLATVLTQYVRPTIVEHFLRILVQFDSQKRTMLQSTSRLCLSLGQEQQGIIEESVATGQLQAGSNAHHELIRMADDLWETGTILANVTTNDSEEEYEPFEIKDLIVTAINNLGEGMSLQGIRFNVEGSCMIEARQDDLYIVVIRVLQWLAQRRIETPLGLEPEISVRCADVNGTSQIIFEDRSKRLPKRLRDRLYTPFFISAIPPLDAKLPGPGFYLPLYLAKMLIEEKYGGWLDDKSDELEGDVGHRLVIRFESVGRNRENAIR